MATKTLTRSMTFEQFAAAIGASQLNKGEGITITDFATVHYLTDGLIAQALSEGNPVVITGETEPLTVFATSSNTIDVIAKSTLFPNDIIHYDWDANNWMDNINFVTGETPTLIPGFKGVITYREDTVLNNSANHDFRNCKNRLWSIDQSEWSDTPGEYSTGEYVKVTGDSTFIYVAIDNCVSTDVPGVADDKWLKVFDITHNVYWSNNSTSLSVNGTYSIPVTNLSDFVDYGIFGYEYGHCTNVRYSKGIIDLTILMD